MFVYISSIYVVSVVGTFRYIKTQFPLVYSFYASRLKASAIVGGLSLFIQFVFNLAIGLAFKVKDTPSTIQM